MVKWRVLSKRSLSRADVVTCVTSQDCLPLIDDLSNSAMRTRHWKQLVRVTGGAIQVDNETLKKMTLGELLSLGLQSKKQLFLVHFMT